MFRDLMDDGLKTNFQAQLDQKKHRTVENDNRDTGEDVIEPFPASLQFSLPQFRAEGRFN